MPKKGFTLIELLVVVSIIALLSVIGLVIYSAFLKNARDSSRQSDLKLIQSALEDYHADQLSYPSSVISGSVLSSGSRTYMNKVPTDPKGAAYSYVASPLGCTGSASGTACASYCLSANLEGVDLADECTPASGNNYGVTRP